MISISNKKFVPDTSAIINGKVTELIKKSKIKGELIIPEFVVSELENQANRGRDIGFEGLEELKNIRRIYKKKKIKISGAGRQPTAEEIKLASGGRIDALIRNIAKENNAVLITSDKVQAKVAEAEDLEVLYFETEKIIKLGLKKYFDNKTMSVHLKEGTLPKAKRGTPGKFKLETIGKKLLTKEKLEELAKEITDATRVEETGFVEINSYGAKVVQLGQYRIAITRTPFSEKMEITAVRPILKVDLDHYTLSKRLKERLEQKAEGILIAGPPGSGKSTLAAAMAEFYQKQDKIVKTMEHPRDLQVNNEITQYSPLEKDMVKTADILLLVRPDLTIYDEVRKTKDFMVFADMRLAGVGMIGVVHATRAIDAIHRFIGRVELGLIPQIIDTIIFVKDGEIKEVYSMNLTVKVPTGMVEEDLSRPIVEVLDFETGKLKYEIYSYGEQTVIMPVKGKEASTIRKLAEDQLRISLKRYVKNFDIQIISDSRAVIKVDEKYIPRLIGKKGSTISKIEKNVGISLSVEPIVETLKKKINYDLIEIGGYLTLKVNPKYIGKVTDIYKGDEFLFSATVGKKGQIKVKRKSELGEKVLQAFALKNLKILI